MPSGVLLAVARLRLAVFVGNEDNVVEMIATGALVGNARREDP